MANISKRENGVGAAILRRMIQPPLLAAAAAVAWLGWSVGGAMHESDQASMLSGALRLARGLTSRWHAAEYLYDKQYLTYWLVEAALRFFPRADPLLAGNVLSFAAWWSAVLLLLAVRPCRSTPARTGAAAVVLAPALLVHTPFLAGNFLSGAFLIGAFAAAAASAGWATGLAAALLFCATACRADALLLVPLLLWLTAPRAALSGLLRARRTWLFTAAALAAALCGCGIGAAPSPPWYRFWFHPQVWAAYAAFGLGGAGVLLLAVLALLVRGAASPGRRGRGGFMAAGAAALLLPVVFYAPQLVTTRHWTPTLIALLMLCCSERGQALLRLPRRRWRVLLVTAVAVATALPLFCGLRLPAPSRPRLVVRSATRFPTHDGHVPMGAYLDFLAERGRRPDGEIDHNQRVWRAARSVRTWDEEENGRVPLLPSNMSSYLELAVLMRGGRPMLLQEPAPHETGFVYADLRSLLRPGHEPAAGGAHDYRPLAARCDAEVVSEGGGLYRVVRLSPGEPPRWMRRGLALAGLLGGREFRWAQIPAGAEIPPGIADRPGSGHSWAVVGARPFELLTREEDGAAERVAARPLDGGWFGLRGPGGRWPDSVQAAGASVSQPFDLGVAVLPDYMSPDRL